MVETEGVIVLISTGTGYPHRTSFEKATRVLLWLVFSFLLAPVILALWMTAKLLSDSSQPSFFSRVVQRALGYWLAARMLHLNSVPVQDLRVHETRTGSIRLVRVAGHLAGGSFSRGDSVSLRGREFHGTLLFREGVNHTIHSKIILQ